jgi:hypothetical protein
MIRASDTDRSVIVTPERASRPRWAGGRLTLPLLCLQLGVALLSATPASAASPIGVEFSEWGFDDRAVPRKFNLLSFEIQNRIGKPFDGTIRLRRLIGTSPAGAELVQRVYLGPFQKRLVQFTPYVYDYSEEWELRWGETLDDAYTVELARLGIGARVILNDPLSTSSLASGLRGFREDRFPRSVIGTDTLLCAAVDHAPRWEKARRDVFRDWLHRGGVLHVFHGVDGKFPQLPIAELNAAGQVSRFGTGRIYWHEMERAQLRDNRDYIYKNVYPTAAVAVPITDLVSRNDTSEVDPTSREFTAQLSGKDFLGTYSEWDSDTVIPLALRDFVQAQTQHNWPVIYLLAVVYLVLIFPGGPWLAKKLDYRLNLLALIVLVSAWSWFYAAVGSRGYGERTSTQSLAIAKPLPDGRWDVEQWSGVFVTDGDQYTVTHEGEVRSYTGLVKNGERVDGYVTNGRDGRFVVDIPPFTSRTMAHRAVVNMPGPQIKVLDAAWSRAGQIQRVTLQTVGNFPTNIHSAYLIADGRISSVELNQLRGTASLTMDRSLNPLQFFDLERRHSRRDRQQESEDRFFARQASTLLARDIGIRRYVDRQEFRLPRDVVRLCVYADLPAELACRNGKNPDETMGEQKGRVLYSIDLPVTPPVTTGKP